MVDFAVAQEYLHLTRSAVLPPVFGAHDQNNQGGHHAKCCPSYPVGYHSITPGLTCKDAGRAMDFYKQIFGATEIMRMAGPDGKSCTASSESATPSFSSLTSFRHVLRTNARRHKPVSIFMYTENVDATFNRAVAAGAKVDMPLMDQFWGTAMETH